MKGLIFCKNTKPYLVQGVAKPMHTLDLNNPFNFNWKLVNKGFSNDRLNGTIVAECDYEVEEITDDRLARAISDEKFFIERDNLLRGSCLTGEEIKKYFNFYNWKFEKQDKIVGYAVYVKNLHIFDKPKSLTDFYIKSNTKGEQSDDVLIDNQWYKPLTKTFRTFTQVKRVLQEDAILISRNAEEVCRILNGKQSIIVVKDILKEM